MKNTFTLLALLLCFHSIEAQQFTYVPTNISNMVDGDMDWGDYDNDGDMDIVIMGRNAGVCFTKVYRNDGNFVFTDINAALPALFNHSADPIKWGDYNNDGLLDILLTGNQCSPSSMTRIYTNDGNGNFTPLAQTFPANNSNEGVGGSVGWADFDNDGWLDFVHKGYSTPCNYFGYVHKNNGDGTFTQIATIFGTDNGKLETGDVNNDGLPDIITSGFHFCAANSGSTKYYRNDGNFTFTEINLVNSMNGNMRLSDLDTDGFKDLLITGGNNPVPMIQLYKNDGTGNLTSVNSILPAINVRFSLGDYDGDGVSDIYYRGLYRNDGAMNFSPVPSNISLLDGPSYWVDMDNDGDDDLIVTGDSVGNITKVYRNNINLCTNIDITSDLISSYLFSGNTNDSGINLNHGILFGPLLTSDRFGNINGAYDFDGIDDYIEIADSPSLQFASNLQTISFWMKVPQIPMPVNEHSLLEKMDQHISTDPTGESAQGFKISFGSNSDILYSIKSGDQSTWGTVSLPSSSLSANQYLHLAFTNDNDSLRSFLDGVKINSVKIPSGTIIGANNSPFLIGKELWTSNGSPMDYYRGILDDIVIYERALSECEIDSLYNLPNPMINSNCLVSYYPFNGNADDSASTGNHGIVSGATLSSDRFGNPNSAYAFNGAGDFIEIPHSPLFNGTEFSIGFWAQTPMTPSSTGGGFGVNPGIVTKLNSSGTYPPPDGFHFYEIGGQSNLSFGGMNGNTTYSGITNLFTDSLFHFYLFTYKQGDTIKYYRDNSLFYFSVGDDMVHNNEPVRLGTSNSSFWKSFQGVIDDLSIYNCALSDSEITALYNNFHTGIVETKQDNLISVSPNPANTYIDVKAVTPGRTTVEIQLINALGRIVMSFLVNNSMTSRIGIERLKAGSYLLKAISGDRQSQHTLIIIH